MEHETENKEAEKFQPVNYQEKIAQQTEIVKKLTASHKKNPSAETELELDRETDTLRHYETAAKGNPKERARLAAEFARTITLNRAVQQTAPEE
jgi:hypothetical protein